MSVWIAGSRLGISGKPLVNLMDEICAALIDVSNFDPKSDPELKAYGEAAIAALSQKSNGADGNGAKEPDELDAD